MNTQHLRELMAKATPGPWFSVREGAITSFPDGSGVQISKFHGLKFYVNSDFVVAVRNALPAILDRLDALEEVANAAREVNHNMFLEEEAHVPFYVMDEEIGDLLKKAIARQNAV